LIHAPPGVCVERLAAHLPIIFPPCGASDFSALAPADSKQRVAARVLSLVAAPVK